MHYSFVLFILGILKVKYSFGFGLGLGGGCGCRPPPCPLLPPAPVIEFCNKCKNLFSCVLPQ